MSVLGNPLLLGSADQYRISRSLRFNSSDSAFCSRTPSSAGNRRTWTLSLWVKRSGLGAYQRIFNSRNPGVAADYIRFNNDDTLELYFGAALITTQVFRDPSSWYHLVIAVDTTQATSGNRVKLYVNGSQVSTFGTANYPSPNADTLFNATLIHTLGTGDGTTEYFSGYLANVEFVDGQQLTSSSFTEVSATTGQLIPKKYTGTFGTNGFWLQFADNSSNTATTLGKDTSGNNNNWDCFNLQTTTGGPTSVAAASGALPIYNTTDTYGTTKGSGTRTDSNSSSIVLAIPMDGANNGTTFTDESATIKGNGSAKTITVNGDAKTVTAQSKYYGSSGYFDGNGDKLTGASSADLSMTGDFTVECWVRWAGGSTPYQNFVGSNSPSSFSNNDCFFRVWGTSVTAQLQNKVGIGNPTHDGTSAVYSVSSLPVNIWTHVAAVRSSGIIRLYVNGLLERTGSTDNSTYDFGQNGFCVGAAPWDGVNGFYSGYIQDLRIYKGVAKYTSNFNPPSSTQNATVAAGNDSLVDTPTSYGTDTGAGGEVRGNYCTWNPLDKASNTTLSNGNLDVNTSGGTTNNAFGTTRASFGLSSGKWYWEVTPTSFTDGGILGIMQASASLVTAVGQDANGWGYLDGGNKYTNASASSYGASWTTNDVIGVAFDADAGTLTFYKNGSSQGTAFTGLTSGPYFPSISDNAGSSTTGSTFVVNFGQRPWAFPSSVPSGFKALCDTNLPTPVVAKPSTYFDIITYSGNGSSLTLPNANSTPQSIAFDPDLVWFKQRSSPKRDNNVFDIIRGSTKLLSTNGTSADASTYDVYPGTGSEQTVSGLTAFNTGSKTFDVGSSNVANGNAASYVAWCWDAGTTTTTINANAYSAGVPSITSSVRANASAGFSICTFSVTTANSISTFGTGLNASPEFVIIKPRNTAIDWAVFHNFSGTSPLQARLQLNTTAARYAYGYDVWSRSSTTLGVYSTILAAPGTAIDCVAYCFAPVAGYSAMGSYLANQSTDGPFCYCNFRPRWIMLKRSDSTESWIIIDAARDTYNLSGNNLFPNLSNAESGSASLDILSNGFKIRSTTNGGNTSGGTYVWAAFAESPFQYARAR